MSTGRSSTFVTKSGSVLFFEEHGSSSGLPVVCLHGIGGGAYFFTGFGRRLAQLPAGAEQAARADGVDTSPYRVITIDLPGTGFSRASADAPVDFTLDGMAADLGEFVESHIGGPVVLAGHSFGTILALKAFETWKPGSIRGILFVCGLPKARPNIHERLSARAAEIRAGGARGVRGWGPRVSPGVFAPRTLAQQPEVVGLFERLFEEQVPETYTRIIDVLLAADLNEVVPRVNVPCAAIGGTEDSYAPPEALRAFTASLTALPASHAPCVTTVLEGAGHMAFYEQPAAFADAARAFLGTLR